MRTALHNVRRQRNRFAIWAWSPIIVLRVSLLLKYAGFTYAAIIAFMAGVPIFDLTTPPGWTPVWAVCLGLSAILSAIGSTTDKWNSLERWASLGLSACILAYAIGLNLAGWVYGDLNRLFAGAMAIVVLVLPATRFVYLAAQSGKKYVELPSG